MTELGSMYYLVTCSVTGHWKEREEVASQQCYAVTVCRERHGGLEKYKVTSFIR